MATWRQHVAAFFDPTVAVNSDGHLVNANGFFDSGSDSTDYLEESDLSDVRDFFYGPSGNPTTNIGDGFVNSDSVGSQPQEVVDQLLEELDQAAVQQQEASQSSADRAMEFSADEAEKNRLFNAEQAYINRLFNAEEANINRLFNADQAQLNRDFQLNMSNTAYQRAMADLKAAGLNPKLVAHLGGASTPSGSSASGSAASGSAASGSAASGVSANMTASSVSAISGVLSTYITGADALDRQNRGFVQNILLALVGAAVK